MESNDNNNNDDDDDDDDDDNGNTVRQRPLMRTTPSVSTQDEMLSMNGFLFEPKSAENELLQVSEK